MVLLLNAARTLQSYLCLKQLVAEVARQLCLPDATGPQRAGK